MRSRPTITPLAIGLVLTMLGAGLGASLTIALHSRGGSAPAPALVDERLDRIETQVAALALALERTGPLQRPESRASSPAPAASQRLDSLLAVESTLDPVAAQRQRDQQLAALERQHLAEPVDPEWASHAEQLLVDIPRLSGLEATGLAPESLDLECRSDSCRIVADFVIAGDAQDWGPMFTSQTGNLLISATTLVVEHPDGTAQLHIYGRRRR